MKANGDFFKQKVQMLKWLIDLCPQSKVDWKLFFNFLQESPSALTYIIFTEQVMYTPRGISFSFDSSDPNPILYYKGQYTYTNFEQAFHDFRLNLLGQEETFYLEIYHPEYFAQAMYLNVMEDNPFQPLHLHHLDRVNYYIEALERQVYYQEIRRLMDEALDQGDYQQMEKYLEMITRMEE